MFLKMENSLILMVIIMWVSGKIIQFKVKDYLLVKMVLGIKVFFLMICKMVKE